MGADSKLGKSTRGGRVPKQSAKVAEAVAHAAAAVAERAKTPPRARRAQPSAAATAATAAVDGSTTSTIDNTKESSVDNNSSVEMQLLREQLRVAQEEKAEAVAAAKQLQQEQRQLQTEHARTVGELQGQGALVQHLSEQARGHSDELAKATVAASEAARAPLEAQLAEARRECAAKLEAARAEGLAQGRAEAPPAPAPAPAPAQEGEEEEEVPQVMDALAEATLPTAAEPAAVGLGAAGPSRKKNKTRAPAAGKKCTPPKRAPAAGIAKPRKYKVYVQNERLEPERTRVASKEDFGRVDWFAEMQVATKQDLQEKIARFNIQKRGVTNPQAVKCAHAQSGYKAQGVIELLWCEEAGRQEWWTPGDVESLFRFIERTTWTDMAPKAGTKRYFNQNHRVACLFWGGVITDYASFQDKTNEYAVRKARGYVTGVKELHEMYVAMKGGLVLPPLPEPPADAAAGGSRAAGKKRAAPARKERAEPARKKPAAEAPADSSDEDEDEEGSDSDAYSEHSEDSAGESSSEEEDEEEDEEGEAEGEAGEEGQGAEDSSDEEEELSEYEQQRLRNIAANKQKLVGLGLAKPDAPMPDPEEEEDEEDEAAVSPAARAPTTAAAAFFKAMAGRA